MEFTDEEIENSGVAEDGADNFAASTKRKQKK